MIIDVTALNGKPLMLRRIGEDDYAVRIEEMSMGRIMLKPVSGGSVVWLWSVTGPYLPPELQPGSGDAETLEEAKASLKAKFAAWLHHAAAKDGEGYWHDGSGRVAG